MIAILSGANIDFSRLSFISERASFGDNTRVLVSVVIPEEPGSFMRLYRAIHPRSVFEFSYRYSDPDKANIFMGFGIQDSSKRDAEIKSIFSNLSSHGTLSVLLLIQQECILQIIHKMKSRKPMFDT
jgi:threonine dehydratase